MRDEGDAFYIILYFWIITIFGALFVGHEIAMVNHASEKKTC